MQTRSSKSRPNSEARPGRSTEPLLRTFKGKEGGEKPGATGALVVLSGPPGFLKKGEDARIEERARGKAHTDEEKKVRVKD